MCFVTKFHETLRLIGDRGVQEKDFVRIQIDRVLDIQKWADDLVVHQMT